MNPRVHIANLPSAITAPVLETAFAPFGAITKVFIAMDRDTGMPQGYAFVTYQTETEAAAAVAGMQGAELAGNTLAVSVAREPAPVPVRRAPAPPQRRPQAGGPPRSGAFRR
jgi:RNA recognition motif-containing protein